MKFTKVFLLSAATTLVASLSSCTDNDLGFTANSIKFEQSFVDRFGQIAPDQNWGFGEVQVNTRGNVTRAINTPTTMAGEVHLKVNEWTVAGTDEYLLDKVQIPGWPNYDGYYYGSTSSSSNVALGTPTSTPNSNQAVGDVTDYEIQYVSQWFREHPNPGGIELHLTDFFIQDISHDYDRVSYPNGAKLDKPEGSNDYTTYEMDYLAMKPEGAHGTPDETWTHINDYNQQRANYTPAALKNGATTDNVDPSDYSWSNTYSSRNMKYVTSSGTEDFAYRESWSTEGGAVYRNNYRLVHLEWDEKGKDDKIHHREGYYLAFDYAGMKWNANLNNGDGGYEMVYPDGYFSNWIVKITPAYPTGSNSRRVMCEDLGATDDFDFNDVVFDVVYHGNGTANVTVLAAGGTMHITVAGKDVHKYFGVEDGTMVNTGTDLSVKRPVFNFNIETSSTDPYDIPIVVTRGADKFENYELKAEIGKVPQKICTPTTTKWCLERTQIETAYPKFTEWVADTDVTWTEDVVNSMLYDDGTVVVPVTPPSAEKHSVTIGVEDASKGSVKFVNSDGAAIDAGNELSNLTQGTNVYIQAISADGYVFDKWDDGNTDNPRTVTVGNSDVTYTAIFKSAPVSSIVLWSSSDGATESFSITDFDKVEAFKKLTSGRVVRFYFTITSNDYWSVGLQNSWVSAAKWQYPNYTEGYIDVTCVDPTDDVTKASSIDVGLQGVKLTKIELLGN